MWTEDVDFYTLLTSTVRSYKTEAEEDANARFYPL